MASRQAINTFHLSLGMYVPILLDLAYQEGYLVPTTFPNFYTTSRLNELAKPPSRPVGIPTSLTFTRYRTQNPWHVQYVHAKKAFWRYIVMWPFLGVVTTALQSNHLLTSLILRRPTGAIVALSAITLTWGTVIVEGNARKMYIDEMYQRVMKEEEIY
jgi:hypothetical protein